MKSPKQVLSELRLLKEKLPAPLQKKVGNVLFGGNWKITKLQGIKPPEDGVAEPNTEWETDLYARISNWTFRSSNQIANYFKKNKELLDQLAKEFPEVLQPPIGQVAYRGTSIKLNSLEQAFRKKKFTVMRIAGREVFHFKNLDYTPSRSSQSWTTNPKVAFQFEGEYGKGTDGVVQVVYVTKVNKDFIFNPNLLSILFDRDERETVRVSKDGTFEAFVDSRVIINAWNLPPEENFIHKLPSAKPFFAEMIKKYNKIVDRENKQVGTDYAHHVESIEDIIKFGDEIDISFNFKQEYTKYAKKYIKSVKDK